MEKKELQQALRESWGALHEKDKQHKKDIQRVREEVLHDISSFVRMQKVSTKEQAEMLLWVEGIIESYRYQILSKTYDEKM